LRSPISICLFYQSDALAQLLVQYLRGTPPGNHVGGRYTVSQFDKTQEFLDFLKQGVHHVDCLILQDDPSVSALIEQLKQQESFFPIVVVREGDAFYSEGHGLGSVQSEKTAQSENQGEKAEAVNPGWMEGQNAEQQDSSAKNVLPSFDYSAIVLALNKDQFAQIGFAIDQAISKFIQLSLPTSAEDAPAAVEAVEFPSSRSLSLKAQQLRLAEKLKERLGYLGVYYKRNPQNFLRHMTEEQREELLRQLQNEYREIILTYFSDHPGLNQKIDNFVNIAFFADIPVSQIVEIHMDLMDEFSKQLKIEGRSDEVLQDYRLTLIDTIAHLCEMYRRSIPRET
jgi:circadian clock protein KaiA